MLKDLNLIPKNYIKQKKLRAKRVYRILIASAIGIAIILAIALPLIIKMDLQRQMDKLEGQVKETSNYVAVEKQFNIIDEMYTKRGSEAEALRKYGLDINTIMNKLEANLPTKMFINNMNLSFESDGVELTLDGLAASEDEIATYVYHLRNENYFKSVLLISVNKGTVSEQKADPLTPAKQTQGESVYAFNIAIKGIDGDYSTKKQLLYRNDLNGFMVTYPKKWEKLEGATGSVVGFLAPKENPEDSFRENVRISAYTLSSPMMNLEELTKETVKELENSITDFSMIASKDDKLSGNDVHWITYTGKIDSKKYKFKQLLILKANKAYALTFIAEEDKYDATIKDAESILNSFVTAG